MEIAVVLTVIGSIAAGALVYGYRVQTKGKELGPTDAVAVMPWDVIKHAFQQFRHASFTTERTGPWIEVEATVDEVEWLLAGQHFAPWNKFSFNYKGEVLNMRRIESVSDGEGDDLTYWQLHVRVFERPNGNVEVRAHTEECPLVHPEEHIDMENVTTDGAMDRMRSIFENADMAVVEKGV